MNPTYAKLWALTIAAALIFCAYLFRGDTDLRDNLLSGAMLIAAGVGVGWQLLRRSGDAPTTGESAKPKPREPDSAGDDSDGDEA